MKQDVHELKQEDVSFQANLYSSANPTRRWLHQSRRNWVLSKLDEIPEPLAKSAVEIGIGCGVFTEYLSRRFGSVSAVDINQEFVERVSTLPRVAAYVADILQFDEEARYDIALCSEVIEHISNSSIALRNIYRALKPGGVLILTTPHRYSTMEIFARALSLRPVVWLARRVYGEAVADLGHINRLSRRQLREQIASAGFEIAESFDCGLYLPILAETCGETGRQIAEKIEQKFRSASLTSQLLWTQCHVLHKPI